MSETEEEKQTSVFPTVHTDLVLKTLSTLVCLITELSFLVCFSPHSPLPVCLYVICMKIFYLFTYWLLNLVYWKTPLCETAGIET